MQENPLTIDKKPCIHFESSYLLFFILIVLFILLLKPGLNLYYQMTAAKYIATITGNRSDRDLFLACATKVRLSEEGLNSLNKITQDLRDFNKTILSGGKIEYLLGKLLCFSGNYPDAVYFLRNYKNKNPNNPLANLEFSFAMVNARLTGSGTEKLDNEDVIEIRYAIRNSGINDAMIVDASEDSFMKGKFQTAQSYLELLQAISSIPPQMQFHFDIAKLINTGDQSHQSDSLNIRNIINSVEIFPEEMAMLSNNQPFLVRSINNQHVGALLSNNEQAVFLGRFQISDDYCFTINALGLPPAPTTLTVTLDLIPVHEIEITSDNGKLSDYFFKAYIINGFHLVGVILSNDLFENGLDRNGYVGSIKIERCKQ